MGTDITIFAERKTEDGTWELVDDPREHNEPYNYPNQKLLPHSVYDGRNYSLFAILADCRNGTRTEEPFKPIDQPRGVPDDMSELASKLYGDGEGWHNETWYFVEEITNFDWSQTIQCAGYIDEKFAYLFDGNPLGYPSEELRRLQNPDAKPGQATVTSGPAHYSVDWVKVRWRETYRSAAGFFHQQFAPYSKPEQPNSVRIVMWFS